MVYSMTGFGASTKKTDRLTVAVEMKSVNHRFCEISIRSLDNGLCLRIK
ncbi:hypothetical protein LR69_02652 [Geobacillus sp. BCO2]|nr:hypothetical protein LR69_02652 [Geobacillus sp. BCO2]